MKMSFYSHANKTHFQSRKILQACVAKWLTPRTPYLDVQGASLTRHIVSFLAMNFTPLCVSSLKCIN